MAHVEKYQAAALGNMTAHYERKPEIQRGFRRDNIDPQRTPLNYNLAPNRGSDAVGFINERIESLKLKRKLRANAVRMADWVITQPQDLDPSESRAFFSSVYNHLAQTYGVENVVSAYVHLDESQPHMHFAFVPVTEDGRLSAKDVLNRNHLKVFHKKLQDAVETDLGHHVGITIDDEKKAEKAAKYVDMPEFQAATQKLSELSGQIDEKQKNYDYWVGQQEVLFAAIDQQIKESEEIEQRRVESAQRLQEQQSEIAEAKEQLLELENSTNTEAEELERVKSEKAQEKASLNEIKQAIPDERAKLEGLQNENAKLSARTAELSGQISEKNEKIEAQNEVLSQNSKKMRQQQTSISENSSELSRLKDDIKTETDRLESVRQARGRADVRIELLESIVGALREFETARRSERGQVLAQIRDAIGKFLARFRTRDERVSSEVLQQQRVEEPATEPQRSVQEPVKAQRGLSEIAAEKQELASTLSHAGAADVVASVRAARVGRDSGASDQRRNRGISPGR